MKASKDNERGRAVMRNVIRSIVVVAAALAVAAGLWAGSGTQASTAVAASRTATAHRVTVHSLLGACKHGETTGIDGHTYMCVQQAPGDVCEAALNVSKCWWFTGTKSQVVFDRAGLAVVA